MSSPAPQPAHEQRAATTARIARAAQLLQHALDTFTTVHGQRLAAQWREHANNPYTERAGTVLNQISEASLDPGGAIRDAARNLHTAVDQYQRQGDSLASQQAVAASQSDLVAELPGLAAEGAIRRVGMRMARIVDAAINQRGNRPTDDPADQLTDQAAGQPAGQDTDRPTMRAETAWREMPLWEVWPAVFPLESEAIPWPAREVPDRMQRSILGVCDGLWEAKQYFEAGDYDYTHHALDNVNLVLDQIEQPHTAEPEPSVGEMTLPLRGVMTDPTTDSTTDPTTDPATGLATEAGPGTGGERDVGLE